MLPIVQERNEPPSSYRISSKAVPGSSPATASATPATAGSARLARRAVLQVLVRGSLSRSRRGPRFVPELLEPLPICVPPRCRRTSGAHAPSKPLLGSDPLRRSDQSPHNHPPAAFLGTSSGALWDARPCDPGCRRTIPPAGFGLLPADRLARRSIVARFSFFPVPAPTPEPARRRHAASRLPSRALAKLRSVASPVCSS